PELLQVRAEAGRDAAEPILKAIEAQRDRLVPDAEVERLQEVIDGIVGSEHVGVGLLGELSNQVEATHLAVDEVLRGVDTALAAIAAVASRHRGRAVPASDVEKLQVELPTVDRSVIP